MNRIPARLQRILISTAAFLLLGAIFTGFTWQDEDDYYYKMNKGLETFGQVYREIAQSYVDTVDPDEFISAGIQGMLKTLDPYTVFLRKKEAADIDLLTSGSYGGIGITVGMRDSMVTIVDVLDGYSAQREGVRIGDKIFSINGTTILRGPVDALRDYTRGEPNSTLQMTVLRDGVPDPVTFQLTRENIRVRSVSYSGILGDGVGYIRLERFSTNAGDETRSAILDMQKQGQIKGIVLDLRDNPGGLLESAVDVGAKFLPPAVRSSRHAVVIPTRNGSTARAKNLLPQEFRWSCWSTVVRHRHRRSSPGRSRIWMQVSSLERRASARDWSSRSADSRMKQH